MSENSVPRSFEYFLGRACRKFRRGVLDLSADRMLSQSKYKASKSYISWFENGQVKSTKLIAAYANCDVSQNKELARLIDEAVASYLDQYVQSVKGR